MPESNDRVMEIVFDRITDPADLDAIVDLEARCFTNPWTRDMLERELVQSDVAHIFVARRADGGVVAFCACWIVVDELHINTMAVDFPYRRQGIATRFLEFVMREAARLGARRATLEVRESNAPARRLYETLGFEVTAVRPKYYTQPEDDALILWRSDLASLAGSDIWSQKS